MAANLGTEGMPWVEKYRPSTIDDVAQQEEVVAALRNTIGSGELPNLLFYGPPGTGKTTVALALVQQLFGKQWRERTKEMNASDERGISAVREQIKTFAQLAIGSCGEDLAKAKAHFRVIILDEADSMTHDAQAALRRIMEEFVGVTRFIIICNYVSKIIEPLHSRCSKFRFQSIGDSFQKERLLTICEREKVTLEPGALDTLVNLAHGDLRHSVTLLQTAHSFYDKIDSKSLVECACAVPDEMVRELLAKTRAAPSTDAVVQLVRDFLCEGYSGQQILERFFQHIVDDPSVPDIVKANCAIMLSQTDERLTEGCDEELQLSQLFAQIRPLIAAR